MLIYKVTNRINGKIYIGLTSRSLEYRKKCHLYDLKYGKTKCYFHKCLKKYGIENFDWLEIEKCKSKQELNEREKYWIAFYNSNNLEFGMNLTKGGEGVSGFGHPHTEEFKKALAERNKVFFKGRKLSEEHKAKMVANRQPHSQETKEKIRLKAIGRQGSKHTDEWRNEHSKRMSGDNNPNSAVSKAQRLKQNESV